MPEANFPGVVVPTIPPRPSQVNLLTSSLRPGDGSDPASPTFSVGADQLALLPDELRAELEARKGEAWTRGIRYAPEQGRPAEVRDRCDFTSVDSPALLAPSGVTLKATAGGGTVPAEALEYVVTAVNTNGETTASLPFTITPGAIGTVAVTIPVESDIASYRVYRCKEGVKKPLRITSKAGGKSVNPVPPPTKEGATTVEFLDIGEAGEAGKEPPTSNTTGGVLSYLNPAIVEYVPIIILTADECSSFGFSERDFKGRALRWLDNATPQALEKELWTGALAQAKGYPNNYLMQSGVVEDLTGGGTPPSVERGLSILQDALMNGTTNVKTFGGQGMIHCQPQTLLSITKAAAGVRRVGQMIFDTMDNIIVPGAGYPGTGPAGVAPKAGCAFMAATDLVMTRTEAEGTVFPETFAEAMDWGQGNRPNSIRFAAQRFAAAYFDGLRQFCIEVTLPT